MARADLAGCTDSDQLCDPGTSLTPVCSPVSDRGCDTPANSQGCCEDQLRLEYLCLPVWVCAVQAVESVMHTQCFLSLKGEQIRIAEKRVAYITTRKILLFLS